MENNYAFIDSQNLNLGIRDQGWRGSQRWSLNTLWRAYRSALWGQHDFHPLFTPTTRDWAEKETLLLALRNAIFASARS